LSDALDTHANGRLRVLIANSTLHIGGAEKVAANLATHLDREKFETTAVYLKENGVVGEQMQRQGVDLVPIPGMKPLGPDGKRRPDYFTAFKLLKLIRQRRIQLIHTHDMHSFIDAAIVRMVYPKVRYVHTIHWGNYPTIEPQYARIERALWRVPDAIVCVGHEQSKAFRDFYGIPEKRVDVIWNGTDAPAPNLAPEVQAILPGDGRPVIGSISTLIPQKGLDDLLQTAALLRDRGKKFLLLLAGQGTLRASLEERAAQLNLGEYVKFLGWVNDASARALPACDVFVQSSHWEAMSVVVLEAMAQAKPVVATTVGENTRVLTNETDGLLVPPRQPAALADALARVIDDVALRKRLGEAAQRRYREACTISSMVRNHEKLYARLLGRKAGA
jgi:glycosyltransferase involved in cell wall biosynthesis